MKFISGVVLGGLLMWLYGSTRARTVVRERFAGAPELLRQVSHVAVSSASSGAQWASEIIEAAPIPDAVKTTATDAAFNAWATAESIAEQQSGDANHA